MMKIKRKYEKKCSQKDNESSYIWYNLVKKHLIRHQTPQICICQITFFQLNKIVYQTHTANNFCSYKKQNCYLLLKHVSGFHTIKLIYCEQFSNTITSSYKFKALVMSI